MTSPFNSELIAILSLIVNSFIVFFAFYQLREIRKEIRLLEKQVVFQRLQFYPVLEIINYETDEDWISMDIKNEGNGIATKLALRTLIIPLESKESDKFIEELLVVEERTRKPIKINPSYGVIFLKNEVGRFMLYPGKSDSFSARIMVRFKHSKTEWKFYTFEELKELFKYNKIRYAGLICQISYQDYTENITEIEKITNIIIDFEKHKNFSHAITDNNIFTHVTVGLEEIEWLDWNSYVKFKSKRSYLE